MPHMVIEYATHLTGREMKGPLIRYFCLKRKFNMHHNEMNCRHICLSMTNDPEPDAVIVLILTRIPLQHTLRAHSVWFENTSGYVLQLSG